MDSTALANRLTFLRSAEALKKTLRSAHLSDGRQESTAEHSWRLCLWALTFADQAPHLDQNKLLKMALLHDLAECISGDIPAPEQTDRSAKSAQERTDWETLLAPLPHALRIEFMGLWQEYEEARSQEAKFLKGLDKLETIMQHNQGKNPSDFDYAFNLTYGDSYTQSHALLSQIRELLDQDTTQRVAAA